MGATWVWHSDEQIWVLRILAWVGPDIIKEVSLTCRAFRGDDTLRCMDVWVCQGVLWGTSMMVESRVTIWNQTILFFQPRFGNIDTNGRFKMAAP